MLEPEKDTKIRRSAFEHVLKLERHHGVLTAGQLAEGFIFEGEKIHHAAFDAQLIGIDPNYKVHVSEKLLAHRDGAFLDALKSIRGREILLPKRAVDRPDRDRLAARFELFCNEA